MKIRKATLKDFKEYYELKKQETPEYFKITGEKIKIPSKIKLKKEFEKFVNKKDKIIFLVKEDNKFVAYLYGTIYKNIWGEGGYIDDVFVLKGHRKKGITTKLIQETIKKLKKDKIKKLYLGVNVKNKRAIGLYKKMGFKIRRYDMIKKLK